jgi:hypothetical protein
VNEDRKIFRRDFLKYSFNTSGSVVLSSIIPGFWKNEQLATDKNWKNVHPKIFITNRQIKGLNSVHRLKQNIQSGHCLLLWNSIFEEAKKDINANPLLPSSIFPGRDVSSAKHNNPDWTICNAAGQRILRSALVNLISNKEEYKHIVLEQMEALFDKMLWPEWIDQSHKRFGHPADLRTGMLSLDVALAFDWMFPNLTDSEKDFIIDGLDRQGIQPFLKAISQNPWWTKDLNNWLTVIVGGLGIAGMAIDGSHPDSTKLIEYSKPLMKKYMSIYGQDGEFNESVAYANATKYPVMYYLAHQYFSKGKENTLTKRPFPQTCFWMMYMTLPPGRVAAFGDSHVDAKPDIKYIAAVASATKNSFLQWFYLQQTPQKADPLQLLFYDPTIKAKNPDGKMPTGKVFYDHGACISSRTDWNPNSTPCVVYCKAGREENHEHNDIGQLCIDGYGERLIVDLGSPSGYPADFFDKNRWKYYNASITGHNILMIGGRELKVPSRDRGQKFDSNFVNIKGKIIDFNFEERIGGYWKMNLTNAYQNVRSVRRSVIHFFPGIVVVLDEAKLLQEEEISLRWHTINNKEPDKNGNFLEEGENSKLFGYVQNLNKENVTLKRREHSYQSPFDKNRLGDPLVQRRECFIEAKTNAKACKFLSLFSVESKGGKQSKWDKLSSNWQIETSEGLISVEVNSREFSVSNVKTNKKLSVGLT